MPSFKRHQYFAVTGKNRNFDGKLDQITHKYFNYIS